MVSVVGNVLLIFMVRSGCSVSHWVYVLTVETTVVHWAVVEVLIIVMSVVMAVLDLVMGIVVLGIVVNGNVLWLMSMREIKWKIVVDRCVDGLVMVSVSFLQSVVAVLGAVGNGIVSCCVVVGAMSSVVVRACLLYTSPSPRDRG